MDCECVGNVGGDVGGDPLAGVLQGGEKDATGGGGVCLTDCESVDGMSVD